MKTSTDLKYKSISISAQRLLSFYQWSKELMTKLNQNYWDQIKTVLGQVIRENLGKTNLES